MSKNTPAETDIETRARRRVGLKIGFGIHALVFVLVNLGLAVIDVATGGPRWAHFPLWGWGLGLTIHGIVVLASLKGEGLRDRMLQAERDHLNRRS